MKNVLKTFASLLLVAFTVVNFSSCNKDNDPKPEDDKKTEQTSEFQGQWVKETADQMVYKGTIDGANVTYTFNLKDGMTTTATIDAEYPSVEAAQLAYNQLVSSLGEEGISLSKDDITLDGKCIRTTFNTMYEGFEPAMIKDMMSQMNAGQNVK